MAYRTVLSVLFLFAFFGGFAQVNDDFSDGDFTANPVWSGSDSLFEVVGGELHLNDTNATVIGGAALSTPSLALNDATWEFYIRLQNNPSSTNLVEVYLTSDQADLTSSTLNGYFVRIGNTTDEVSLYRVSNGSTSEIIDGRDDIVDVAAPELRVRVTRDALGNWELESDTSATLNNYISEGTTNDVTHLTSSFFGFYTRYTSTRRDWAFFDNVNVTFTPAVDMTPPTIASQSATSATEVSVLFSENIDLSTATTTSNYLLDGTTNPVSATINAADSSEVLLTFGNSFANCTTYDLFMENVEDRAGNVIADTTVTFQYAITGTAGFGDVLINEIFADPTPQIGLPTVEYVELFNNSNQVFDLQDWTISDGGTPQSLTSSSFNFCPGEYLILTTDLSAYDTLGTTLGMSLPTLNNGGDPLGLRDNNGSLIDAVTYDVAWYGGSPQDQGGYSLELINPNDSCATDADNWSASTDPSGGTPGRVNSIFTNQPDTTAPVLTSITVTSANAIEVCFSEKLDSAVGIDPNNYSVNNGLAIANLNYTNPDLSCLAIIFVNPIDTGTIYTLTSANISDCAGNSLPSQTGQFFIPEPIRAKDVIFTEIFADPDTNLTNLPNAEYFELYNRSGNVVDLAGWTFSDASSTITLPAYTLPDGEYVAITPTTNVAALSNFGGNVLGVSSLPSLNNSGDEIGLREPSGILVDTVEYTSQWYQDPDKDDGGYSLELINPDDICSFLGNWIASNDPDGGTPGAQNSVFDNTPDITPPTLVSLNLLSATSAEVCFDETMDAASLANPANYAIDNGLQVSNATPQSPVNACVILTFATAIDTGTVYEITFTNIADCKGNSVGILREQFVQGGSASPGEVLITELMADPTPAVLLPEFDFVELYNAGSSVIDLGGWTIEDPTSTFATLPTYNLLPGEYVVVCDDAAEADFLALGIVNLAVSSSFPSLNSTGDSIYVYDNGGTLMDFVFYEDDWYQDEDKEDGGWTLERIDIDFLCENAGNWRASEDLRGGTPGEVNSIAGQFVDDEAPSLIGATVIGTSIVRVTFSELMDDNGLLDASNYSIDNGIGQPIGVIPVANQPTTFELILVGDLDSSIVYCVTASNVRDCPGNVIGGDNTVCFGVPEPIAAGDLVINEILFNPYSGGSDFVELYNNSDKIVDLSTVFIGEIFEGTDSIYNSDQVSTSQLLLLPRSYICLTADKDFQIETYEPIDPDAIFEMNSFPSYDDGDGECVIYTDNGTVLDRLAYLDDWHFPTLDDENGVSLERHDFDRPTQDEDNWHSAASTVKYATPGYENSQILVSDAGNNEVTLEPETFSPDQDGFEDVLSINYRFPTSGWNARVNVFDSKGRLVRELVPNTLLGTETGTFTWDGTNDAGRKADVGVYVILFETVNPNTGEVKNYKRGCVVAARFN